ncbi:uncharacterized protein J7T54_003416 [Emericellopsis cladophorae]|uniref:Uncharacterized protein n=1 Tax=Emericellopsis cladophorae TaxID=2686198 RepID=A0A9Q0BDK8_9HYPO|nr:uncharacterized protein J7T54_003416 [Emericellopsis cladophorae]KAI6781997.1 hypothetical protein J7T54_003416 [Emericellopsis cladophorae]
MPKVYEYTEHIHRGGSPPGHRDRDDSPRRSGDRRDPFVRETMTLEPPPSYASRGRSQPPPDTREMVPRGRNPSRGAYYDDDDDDYYARGYSPSNRSRSHRRRSRSRGESPMERAKSVMEDNFTNSTAGISASLIGAIAGGYAARQVSEHVSDNRRTKGAGRRRRSDTDKEERVRLASTLIGAAIGGLGANALTNRFEDSKDRDRLKQQAWERTYGREDGLPHYDSGRHADLDHRNGRGVLRGRSDDEDDDYDFVYDRRSDDGLRRPRRHDSDDSYRYR